IEIAAVSNFENSRFFADVHDTLVLVFKVDVDLKFTAEPSLVLKRTREMQLIVFDTPFRKFRLGRSARVRIAVGQNRNKMGTSPETSRQNAKELGLLVQQSVKVETNSHGQFSQGLASGRARGLVGWIPGRCIRRVLEFAEKLRVPFSHGGRGHDPAGCLFD